MCLSVAKCSQALWLFIANAVGFATLFALTDVNRFLPSRLSDNSSDHDYCLLPRLPPGELEVVVGASHCREGAWERLNRWASAIGLTGVTIHIYWREEGCDIKFAAKKLPCDMRYEHHVLLPNLGNEAASFAEYIRARYDSLPRAVAFVHDHGPFKTWHEHCDLFYGRFNAYYKGLSEIHDPTSRYAALTRMPMVSLSGNCLDKDISGWLALSSSPKDADLRAAWHELCTIDAQSTSLKLSHVLEEGNQSSRRLGVKEKKENATFQACSIAVKREEVCPYSEGCNRPAGYFWSCCNSFVVSATALRKQPKRLFETYLSDCALRKEHSSAASGRVMEFSAYTWFGGSETSARDLENILWTQKQQLPFTRRPGCQARKFKVF